MNYREAPIHLTPFLLPTEFCDSDHPSVVEKARSLVPEDSSEFEVASLLRDFIQKTIPYELDFCNVKASDTLKKLTGMCTNKATLQIAMMRALGVPAGYGLVRITRDVFKDTLPEIYENISEPTTHVFACAWINKEERFFYFDGTERGKDIQYYMVELPTGESRYQDRWLRGTITVHSNLDHLFSQPSRWDVRLFERQNKEYQEAKRV